MKYPIFTLVLILICLIGTTAFGTIINVPGDFTTIQTGIDNTVNGDSVLVADGTYIGTGNRDISFNGKEIVLLSENGAEFTIIDCEGSEIEPHSGVIFNNNETSNSVLQGFTIINGYGYHSDDQGILYGGALYIIESSPQIRDCVFNNNYSEAGGAISCRITAMPEIINCIFDNNTSRWGSGIHAKEGSAPHIDNCIFRYNVATTSGAAINLNDATPLIENCLMHNNEALTGGAIKFYYGANAVLQNCTIVNNTAYPGSALNVQGAFPEIYNSIIAFNNNSAAIYCFDGSPTFECTDIYGNTDEDWGYCIGDQLGVNGNISADPLLCNIALDNFSPLEASPCAPENNDCGILLGSEEVITSCSGGTIIVNQDGTGDALTIQGGVDLATTGDTLLVASGTYTGEGNRDITFHGKNVVLQSINGAENTIINCEGTELEPHSGFKFINGESNSAMLDGFTIVNGYAELDFTGDYSRGGGIFLSNSSPIIRKCIFQYNYAEGGGAIGCRTNSSPEIIKCFFEDNSAIWGGAIHIRENANPHVTDCVMKNNSVSSSGGAIDIYASVPVFENNLIYGNTALAGGAIKFYVGANAEIRNCTFVNNSGEYGGAFNIQNSTPEIYNSIIAFNNDSASVYCIQSSPIFECTNIYGNAGGDWVPCIVEHLGVNGNFSTDPLFCNVETEEFTLKLISQCLPENNDCGELIGALSAGCSVACGDCDGSGVIDISDALYLLLYIFAGGPDPMDLSGGDIDCNGAVNISDAVYLIYYIFLDGPAPCAGC